MTTCIVLAQDARAAWLEILPELRVSFRDEAEVDAFLRRAAAAGLELRAENSQTTYRSRGQE